MNQRPIPLASAETVQARQALMAVLARATLAQIEAGLAGLGPLPPVQEVRPPEIGLVMLRGRAGGTGAPFNLGEASVTRAVVETGAGYRGFSYILGRDPAKARLAALVDALWQDAAARPDIESRVVAPIRASLAQADARRAAETAETRVDFFTLVRGED